MLYDWRRAVRSAIWTLEGAAEDAPAEAAEEIRAAIEVLKRAAKPPE